MNNGNSQLISANGDFALTGVPTHPWLLKKKRVHIDCKAVVAVHSTGWRRAIADIANHMGTAYVPILASMTAENVITLTAKLYVIAYLPQVHSTGWRRAIADIANPMGTAYLGT